MSAARAKAKPRALPVAQEPGCTIPPDTCHLSHCTQPPAPGPTLLCAGHLASAKTAPMLYDGRGMAWGACLRGCASTCELGKWTTKSAFREYHPQKSGCEHLPAHIIRLAQGTIIRRAFVDDRINE